MATKNFILLLHGILPRPGPDGSCVSVDTQYDQLLAGLVTAEPSLEQLLESASVIGVHWGHPCPNGDRPATPDQKLTVAQTFVAERIGYDKIRKAADDGEETIRDVPFLGVDRLKESLFVHGLSDAVYYCSQEGESIIRTQVYGRVLRQIQAQSQLKDTIRLHVVAHSLGAAIAFDFLFGLFNRAKGYRPDLLGPLERSSDPELRQYAAEAHELQELFGNYRVGANLNSVQLGSLATCGSQLPTLLFRRQHVVERLARRELLDPAVIGLPRAEASSPPLWINFYDRDDVLGYPIRPLFKHAGHIQEIQVETGGLTRSHGGYWSDRKGVLPRIAELLRSNIR